MIKSFEEMAEKIEFLYCNLCKEKIYDKTQILEILRNYPQFISTYFRVNHKSSTPFPVGFGLCPFKSNCGGLLIPYFPTQMELVESFLMDMGEELDDKYLYREFLNGLPTNSTTKSNFAIFFSNILKKIPFFILAYSFIENQNKHPNLEE